MMENMVCEKLPGANLWVILIPSGVPPAPTRAIVVWWRLWCGGKRICSSTCLHSVVPWVAIARRDLDGVAISIWKTMTMINNDRELQSQSYSYCHELGDADHVTSLGKMAFPHCIICRKLGLSRSLLEAMLGPSWGHLVPSCSHLGTTLGHLGPSWGHLGPSWGHLGPIVCPSCAHRGAILGHLGPSLGHPGAILGLLAPLRGLERKERDSGWSVRGLWDGFWRYTEHVQKLWVVRCFAKVLGVPKGSWEGLWTVLGVVWRAVGRSLAILGKSCGV